MFLATGKSKNSKSRFRGAKLETEANGNFDTPTQGALVSQLLID